VPPATEGEKQISFNEAKKDRKYGVRKLWNGSLAAAGTVKNMFSAAGLHQ
jgi:hypothetical protein